MLGTLGTPEMIFIFLLALLLFGPKKLPEIGRTVGKALTEFRRASNELKATFDREIRTLEAETKTLDITGQQHDTYNYDYSSYDSSYEGSYGSESYDSATDTTTASVSAPEDAESPSAVAVEGAIARGSETAESHETGGEAAPSTTAEHNA